jgi:hypothetical protein
VWNGADVESRVAIIIHALFYLSCWALCIFGNSLKSLLEQSREKNNNI